jgi:sugar phosphate isomerase/epimerase
MATGVIDTASFVSALDKIGFDGPIAAEPLGASVRNLPPEEALKQVSDAMKKALALIVQGRKAGRAIAHPRWR